MITHYISYFCRENGRKREAVCGAWVTPGEHSAEPTCADCAHWLLQEVGTTCPCGCGATQHHQEYEETRQ